MELLQDFLLFWLCLASVLIVRFGSLQECEHEAAGGGDWSVGGQDRSESITRLAWALVHSRRSEDVQRGIAMLECEYLRCCLESLYLTSHDRSSLVSFLETPFLPSMLSWIQRFCLRGTQYHFRAERSFTFLQLVSTGQVNTYGQDDWLTKPCRSVNNDVV